MNFSFKKDELENDTMLLDFSSKDTTMLYRPDFRSANNSFYKTVFPKDAKEKESTYKAGIYANFSKASDS